MKKIREDQLEYVHSGDTVELRTFRRSHSAEADAAAEDSKTDRKKRGIYMKWHRFFAWATVASFLMTMVTGYKRK